MNKSSCLCWAARIPRPARIPWAVRYFIAATGSLPRVLGSLGAKTALYAYALRFALCVLRSVAALSVGRRALRVNKSAGLLAPDPCEFRGK